jgi:DNA polymerase-3 subunit alpha
LSQSEQIPAEHFAHLHVHSEYSLLDGAIRIKELLQRAKDLGHKSVALTDHGNLFGAIEFYSYAKDYELKPILGSEIFHKGGEDTLAFGATQGHKNPDIGAFHLVLLSKDVAGYKNLIKIVSAGHLAKPAEGETPDEVPTTAEEVLTKHAGGLVALSSCSRGEFAYLVQAIRKFSGKGELSFVGEDEHHQAACAALDTHVQLMRARFGDDYYIELIDNNIPAQKALLKDLVSAAKHYELPLVASADAHYLTKERAQSHAVQIGIKHSLTMSKIRGRLKKAEFHLLSNEEMVKKYGQWPESLTNQKVIADKCNVEFKFGEYFLPKFDTGRDESSEDALRRISREGLESRFEYLRKLYGESFNAESEETYKKRLEYELEVIINMGFPGYFLIVQDFINWAKEQDIPVGPGRGSGAGSIVAYALRITDLDPIPYNLLFERFLNPDRISMPDFDVDFCQDRRDEVIKYVARRYGDDHVAQITTFGKMNAKAVIRDVGRVLELGYGRVDKIAKLIPDDLGITLEKALEMEPRINEEAARDETVALLLRLAKELEGLTRHSSVHAAGLVISDGPMTDYVPVYTTEDDSLVTMFDMKRVEQVGLVKFDFLGLKTLTVIQNAERLVHRTRNPDFDITLIPMDDRSVFNEISQGNSVGIFQLESSGMRNLNLKLKPSCFEDIIAVVALFRPGPLGSGMVDSFIERKHGREKIDYPHPLLEEILKETYGTILYQEQVMKIAQVLASYTLGEADLLRRAMGKKIASEMDKQKVRFMEGATANKIDPKVATDIFDLMAEFAKYGFNKSHSAAYGLVSYQTAFLKTHFPEEFMAAIMTCDLDNTSKIVRYVDECRRLRLEIIPPNLNCSDLEFSVPAPKKVGFGLAAIKGIGAQAVEPIVTERQKNGPFKNLSDLARRVNLRTVGKKTLELLTQVGALDCFGLSRPKLMSVVGDVVKLSESLHTAKSSGQGGLFDEEAEDDDGLGELTWELSELDKRPGAPDPEWLAKEKKLLGVYLTGHPIAFHQQDVKALGSIDLGDIAKSVGRKRAPIICVLAAMNERITKTGNRMAMLRLEGENGPVEAVMFSNDFPEEFPAAGSLIYAEGNIDKSFDGMSIRVRLEHIEPLQSRREEYVRRSTLTVPFSTKTSVETIRPLTRLIQSFEGDTDLKIVLRDQDQKCDLETSTNFRIDLSDEFLYSLLNLELPNQIDFSQ